MALRLAFLLLAIPTPVLAADAPPPTAVSNLSARIGGGGPLGDVSSPYQLKHVANHEARVVKHNLLQPWDDTDNLMPANHANVPSAVFTEPQIASVGLTENQARAAGYRFKTKVQDYSDVAYGWAMEDSTGFAKLIVDDDTAAPVVTPGHALFMDWRPDHGEHGWPTFLYGVPLGGGQVLLHLRLLLGRFRFRETPLEEP